MPSNTDNPPVEKAPAGRRAPHIDPFTVEFGNVYCRNFVINTFRVRVRGAWSVTNLHRRPGGGRDIGQAMASMPDIPGERMTVDVQKMRAVIHDPLEEQLDILEAANAAARQVPGIKARSADWKPVPQREFALSPDLLVTLLRELHRKRDSDDIRIIKGKLPTGGEIAKLEGRELYDPWNSGRKPRYADDVPAWLERLDQQQGV